jgi:hypothetical protein
MQAYRTYLTVTDSKQVVLTDLPFRPGQRVEVLLLAPDEERTDAVAKLRELFRQSQAASSSQDVDEDVIREELAAHRSGR